MKIDVSIVIITYNYADYLAECIESCLSQKENGLNYEIVVVDDGSTDGTQEVLSRYILPIVRSFRIENSGIEKAANFGFSKSRGDFIVRVDADDVLLSGYLAAMECRINQNFDFYYSDYDVIDGAGDLVTVVRLPMFDAGEIKSRGDFLATGTLYRADLLVSLGGYNTEYINSGLENYALMLDILAKGGSGLHIPEVLFGYRRHSTNISKLQIDKIVENGKRLFQMNGLGAFKTNSYHPYGLRVRTE